MTYFLSWYRAQILWCSLGFRTPRIAREQKVALEYFYNNLSATNACDSNELREISILVRQMMDAVGKKYAVHELIFESYEFSWSQKILRN
jgi:hypothetical protein